MNQNELIWNEQMHLIFGTEPDSFDGKYDTWKKYLLPEDAQQIDYQIQLALTHQQEFDTVFRIQHQKSKEIRYIRAFATVSFDINNRPIRMIGINSDITERKKADEERQDLVARLIEKNEQLAEFAFMTSHQLRKPLANILGLIDLLDMPSADKTFQEKLIQGIIDSAKELDKEIHNINYKLK